MTAKIAGLKLALAASVCTTILAASGVAGASAVTQTDLTSDGSVSAAFTDANLKNPWGISYSPTGAFWVSDNATGLTTLYDGTGKTQSLVVTIPAVGGGTTGTPTGQVFNSTSGFVVSEAGKSGAPAFIFASEDGSISAWSPSVDFANAIVAVDHSKKGDSFKGLALYTDKKGRSLLLATDFRHGKVEVFDSSFNLVQSFRDAALPKNYAPYNVAVLGGKVYVTYAEQDSQKHDSVAGVGLGAVEQVSEIGDDSQPPKVEHSFVHGRLNGPWGLAIAPASWGNLAGELLVGNFGDGKIVRLTHNLRPHGVLFTPAKKQVEIDGLWGLIPGNGGMGGDANTIYFSAGPNEEAGGLFGSLTFSP